MAQREVGALGDPPEAQHDHANRPLDMLSHNLICIDTPTNNSWCYIANDKTVSTLRLDFHKSRSSPHSRSHDKTPAHAPDSSRSTRKQFVAPRREYRPIIRLILWTPRSTQYNSRVHGLAEML